MGFLDTWKSLETQVKNLKTEFNNVKGLNEVIDQILSLKDSEIYEKVYEATKLNEEEIEEQKSVNELLKIKQVELASNTLKDPPLYLPPLTDVIISSHFIGTFSMIDFIKYAYKQNSLSQKDLNKSYTLLERIMSSLDKFNTVTDYKTHDEDYYRKLKQMKWNKEGKKLFGKLNSVKRDVILERGWGSASSSFRIGEMFTLGFLAACNAANHN